MNDNDTTKLGSPWGAIIGLAALAVGLGSQLWGIAIAGGIILAIWCWRRLPKATS